MKTELEYNLAEEFEFMRREPALSDGVIANLYNAFGIDTGNMICRKRYVKSAAVRGLWEQISYGCRHYVIPVIQNTLKELRKSSRERQLRNCIYFSMSFNE